MNGDSFRPMAESNSRSPLRENGAIGIEARMQKSKSKPHIDLIASAGRRSRLDGHATDARVSHINRDVQRLASIRAEMRKGETRL